MDDEVLEFNFEGVEPAQFGTFISMPKGEYNMQCTGFRKYFKGDEGGKKQGDPNNPGLEFTMTVNAHPSFSGKELKLYHPLKSENEKFLLNTLMCLIPEFDWNKNGIKVPLSKLAEKVVGRPANGNIDWEINNYEGKRYVKNNLLSLKPFDQSITQPVATEGNPPIIDRGAPSATAQQAAAGVTPAEVDSFLGNWQGSPDPAAAGTSDSGSFSFDEPF